MCETDASVHGQKHESVSVSLACSAMYSNLFIYLFYNTHNRDLQHRGMRYNRFRMNTQYV